VREGGPVTTKKKLPGFGNRRCPSCFLMKDIPAPLPVCRTCIGRVPNKLQSLLASAIISGDKKEILRYSGEVVTTAWGALEENKKRHALSVAEKAS
jgi:hypothetical protein